MGILPALLILAALLFAHSAPGLEEGRLWLYAPTNFQVEARTDGLIALMKRGKGAGYNGVLVTDYKVGNLFDRPANYYRNLERARLASEEAGIEIIPAVMSVGYSDDLPQNDPNLAEGIPVCGVPFIVCGHTATLARDGAMAVRW